jgi:hypothetical protein
MPGDGPYVSHLRLVWFLFSYFVMSSRLGKVEAEQPFLGLPLSNSATGIQTHEMLLEVNYNIHV